jgi:hypothetical protein
MSDQAVEIDDDATGRIMTAGKRSDVTALADEIAAMRRVVTGLVTIEQQRRGATWAVRAIAAAAIALAGAMGARALALAGEAAVDHERLGAVVVDLGDAERRLDAHAADLAEVRRDAAAQTATQVALARAVSELTTEVRELRRELGERRR